MKQPSLRFLLISATASVGLMAVAPASAQVLSNREVFDKLNKLERDVQLVQRQVAREGVSVTGQSGSASAEVRITEIEDELRDLRGKVEENQYQVRRLSEDFERFRKDMDYRLSERSVGEPVNVTESLPNDSGTPPMDTRPRDERQETYGEQVPPRYNEGTVTTTELPSSESAPSGSTAGDGVLRAPSEIPSNFTSPRAHYEQAFRLLNQTRYEEAAGLFSSFIKDYPDDPLIGNAYYWLGETYYIRSNYVDAADNFRQGFEVLPRGPKSADNLLKLAMSLSALNKSQDACVVLDQLLLKFRDSSTTVSQKAEQERNRIGCS